MGSMPKQGDNINVVRYQFIELQRGVFGVIFHAQEFVCCHNRSKSCFLQSLLKVRHAEIGFPLSRI